MAKRAPKAESGDEKPKRPAPAKAAPAKAPATKRVGPPIVVLYGADPFLQAEHTRHLREALEKELGSGGGGEGLQLSQFDGLTAQIADVLDECRSYDLMQRHKLVIADNAEKLVAGDNRPVMERYAEAPSENATLVLRAGKWNKGNLDKQIERAGGSLTKCEPPSEGDAIAWAMKRAEKRHAARLSRESAAALVARVGADLGRIDMEIAKLAVGSKDGEITPELVAELTGRSGEDEAWAVQGPLMSGNAEAGIGAVRDALTLWRQNATTVLWSEVDLIRKAHAMTRMMNQGENPFVAAKKARVWRDGDRLAAMGRSAGAEPLADLLAAAVEADARCKGMGLSDGDLTVETLAARIAMLGRGAGR